VQLRLGQLVTSIDPAAHTVTLADGSPLGYAKLLLTTGSSPRHLAIPGGDLDGVHYLRRVGDSDQIKDAFNLASRVAVIGGGWIGLETAAAARAAGVQVTVLETGRLPLLRVHSHVSADAVIVGVGIVPNSQLALAAGVDVDNGVRVDAQLRTSDPDIYAAGDVANAYHPLLGKHIRVEHWANALHQPQTAAKAMLGQRVAYDRIPLLLHRPVRPRHGIPRLRRSPTATTSSSSEATSPTASSSRSRSRTAACWPA
jgi:3-phenylpropionate/trans-cinnamate dioxygenase ferredoxin reductase subunit